MYRTICCELWTDPKVKALSASEKLLFLYLITNPHSHMSGIYYLPTAFMQHEVGLGRGFDGAWMGLLKSELVEAHPALSQVWVVNMLPYQAKGNKSEKGVASHLNTLHASPLLERFLLRYPQIAQYLSADFIRCPIDTPSNTPLIPHSKLPSPVPDPVSDSSSDSEEGKESEKGELENFHITPELEAWAVKEGITNPGQYVEEFKDYWRSAGGKRKNGQAVKDWAATFRNRIRMLKDQGKLKREDWKAQFCEEAV